MGQDQKQPLSTGAAAPEKGPKRTSVDKALDILAAFDGPGTTVSLGQVVQATGLPKPTAHRLLSTLVAHALVERVDNRYILGPRMFSLGNQVPSAQTLREAATPHLCELRGYTRQSVHLAMLDGEDVVYVEKLGCTNSRLPTAVGRRMPAYCTALGKAMLSVEAHHTPSPPFHGPLVKRTPWTVSDPRRLLKELVDARANGYATERNEAMVGLSCVAVPIFQHGNPRVPVAAVSVSVFGDGSPLTFLQAAQLVASNVSKSLRARAVAS